MAGKSSCGGTTRRAAAVRGPLEADNCLRHRACGVGSRGTGEHGKPLPAQGRPPECRLRERDRRLRTGMEQVTINRLENGQVNNLTLAAVGSYAEEACRRS